MTRQKAASSERDNIGPARTLVVPTLSLGRVLAQQLHECLLHPFSIACCWASTNLRGDRSSSCRIRRYEVVSFIVNFSSLISLGRSFDAPLEWRADPLSFLIIRFGITYCNGWLLRQHRQQTYHLNESNYTTFAKSKFKFKRQPRPWGVP
jgi:hypothetical protein